MSVKSCEDIAAELNNVAEYAGLDVCVEVEEHETDPRLAWVTRYAWLEKSYRKGRQLDRWLVDRDWMYGNARRLPDKVLPEQFVHAIRVSHPDEMGVACKLTLKSWPWGPHDVTLPETST